MAECPDCEGDGTVDCLNCAGTGGVKCPTCEGAGENPNNKEES